MSEYEALPVTVQRFQPEAADYTERVHKRGRPSVAMEPFDAMGVVADGATLESAEAWTLFRATRVADARHVYQAIEGAEFSADLGRVSAAEPFGLIDGEWLHLADVDPEPPEHGTVRPDAIELRCAIEQHGQTRTLTLATDVAIVGDPSSTGDDVGVFVTRSSAITVGELAELMELAIFSAWEDAESDSWGTQRTGFQEEARARATGLLVSEDAALLLRLHDRMREATWLLRGHEAVIRIPADGGAPEIQIDGVAVPSA